MNYELDCWLLYWTLPSLGLYIVAFRQADVPNFFYSLIFLYIPLSLDIYYLPNFFIVSYNQQSGFQAETPFLLFDETQSPNYDV